MENELLRFVRAFPTEDDLIRAIGSLLRRRPGVTDVSITDGTHERGKDVVFCFNGVVGRPEPHACVVKNVKISGTIGANNSADTVLAQARRALRTPYHSADGIDKYITRVLIMSPYEIPQSALYSIEGELHGQVSFCCGLQLLELFNEFWPDFLLESGALGIYVTHLRAEIDRDDPVAVLFSEHNLSPLKRTYVKPKFHADLTSFRIKMDPPEISDFFGKLSLQTARELVSKLRTFSAVAEIEHFWFCKDLTERSTFRAGMARFHSDVHKRWSQSYRRYELATLHEKDTPLSRRYATVELDWTDSETAELSACLSICKDFISYVRKHVEAVNAFLKRTKSVDLVSPLYGEFCELREIASSAQGIVVAEGPSRKEEIPGELVEHAKAVLIAGAAGHGKSSFCYHSAKSDATALLDKKSKLLPVYVKLHGLSSVALGSYQDEFFRTTELKSLASRSNAEALKRVERIKIYLDGLDEIPRVERQREVLELARKAAEEDCRIEVVVTGRDYVAGPWLNWLPRVHLSEMNDLQVRDLVSGLLNDDAEKIRRFYEELSKVPTLQSLVHVPLLATLIVSVFTKRTTLPQTRVELYEIFLALMCGGWDFAKNVRRPTEFGSKGKLSVLTRLAGHLHLNKEKSCGRPEILSAIKASNPSFADLTDQLIEEIVQDGVLTRNGASYEFRHLSFQEYLAAKDLNAPWDQKPRLMLGWFVRGDDWWYQPLSFYIGILAKPAEAEEWILNNFSSVSRERNAAHMSRIITLLECVETSCTGGFRSERLVELRQKLASLHREGRT